MYTFMLVYRLIIWCDELGARWRPRGGPKCIHVGVVPPIATHCTSGRFWIHNENYGSVLKIHVKILHPPPRSIWKSWVCSQNPISCLDPHPSSENPRSINAWSHIWSNYPLTWAQVSSLHPSHHKPVGSFFSFLFFVFWSDGSINWLCSLDNLSIWAFKSHINITHSKQWAMIERHTILSYENQKKRFFEGINLPRRRAKHLMIGKSCRVLIWARNRNRNRYLPRAFPPLFRGIQTPNEESESERKQQTQ